jgi:hypothetical protein
MAQYYGIRKVSNANALFDAFRKSKINSDWKFSVQKYDFDLWKNISEAKRELNDGTYKQKPYVEFDLSERGKLRHIKAISIKDRVVQRSLCDNVLTPVTSSYLIYDNGASQKDKGVTFTRDRLKEHLHRYFRKYGTNEGYVLLVDFKNYFGSIPHEKLKEAYAKVIPEFDLRRLINSLIDENGGDRGMGIGAQLSQNAGIFYPTPLDQYFKTVKAEKYYGAYMDDRYLICRNKEHAKECLREMRKEADLLGLTINEKKTQIVKLSKGFTFLKIRYLLTETGKVVTYQSRDTFIRESRRLKKFKKNSLPPERAAMCYKSWRGSVKQYHNNYYRIKRMDALFKSLFPGTEYRSKKELERLEQKGETDQ